MIHSSTAKAHPGGVKVLQKYHNKDATQAFERVGHSAEAVGMLQKFAVASSNNGGGATNGVRTTSIGTSKASSRWRAKLFTKEDPLMIHKSLGIFCLLHFGYRYFQMYFGDRSAGLGTRQGLGPSWISFACLLPHALLSVSSLIFHVPRDRVVGKPMIWSEFRAHNIVFGLRSVFCAAFCALMIRGFFSPRVTAALCSAVCLAALVLADVITDKLRPNHLESTTATMPYWEGCSIQTQKRFKGFYAWCQFLATFACIGAKNPADPLAVLLPIQLASLLMTLVRKGLLSTKGYHYIYTASLIMPYFLSVRAAVASNGPGLSMVIMYAVTGVLYKLRRYGVNKYVLWGTVFVGRVLYGDPSRPNEAVV